VDIAPGITWVVPPSPAFAAGGMANATVPAIAASSRQTATECLVFFMESLSLPQGVYQIGEV
jgi:hypothetical protein